MDQDSGVGSQTIQFDLDGKLDNVSKNFSRERPSSEASTLN